jgi:hypothetical protein
MQNRYDDEIAPLTEEQWAYIITWHLTRRPQVVPGLVAAQQFQASMTQIQRSAGRSQEECDELAKQLRAMADDMGTK